MSMEAARGTTLRPGGLRCPDSSDQLTTDNMRSPKPIDPEVGVDNQGTDRDLSYINNNDSSEPNKARIYPIAGYLISSRTSNVYTLFLGAKGFCPYGFAIFILRRRLGSRPAIIQIDSDLGATTPTAYFKHYSYRLSIRSLQMLMA